MGCGLRGQSLKETAEQSWALPYMPALVKVLGGMWPQVCTALLSRQLSDVHPISGSTGTDRGSPSEM